MLVKPGVRLVVEACEFRNDDRSGSIDVRVEGDEGFSTNICWAVADRFNAHEALVETCEAARDILRLVKPECPDAMRLLPKMNAALNAAKGTVKT